MMNHGLTSHDEVVSQVASAPWGAYFHPSSRYAPAVSETVRIIARGPSDVLTAKTPVARAILSSPPAHHIGFQPCGFLDAVRVLCYLGTWTLATRSKSLLVNREHAGCFVPASLISEISGIPVGTVKYALSAFCDDGAVQMIRENGAEKFRCDVSFFIT